MTAHEFVDDLESLRSACGLERVASVGHSWGALLAGLYAVAHPNHVERLVLIGADPVSRLPLWPTVNPAERLSSEERTRLAAAQERWMNGVDGACHDFWRILLPAYFGDHSRISTMRGDLCDAPADLPARLRLAAAVRASLGDWDLT
jgi:pimeloyl-ACP methyl ester carboxylesterase